MRIDHAPELPRDVQLPLTICPTASANSSGSFVDGRSATAAVNVPVNSAFDPLTNARQLPLHSRSLRAADQAPCATVNPVLLRSVHVPATVPAVSAMTVKPPVRCTPLPPFADQLPCCDWACAAGPVRIAMETNRAAMRRMNSGEVCYPETWRRRRARGTRARATARQLERAGDGLSTDHRPDGIAKTRSELVRNVRRGVVDLPAPTSSIATRSALRDDIVIRFAVPAGSSADR